MRGTERNGSETCMLATFVIYKPSHGIVYIVDKCNHTMHMFQYRFRFDKIDKPNVRWVVFVCAFCFLLLFFFHLNFSHREKKEISPDGIHMRRWFSSIIAMAILPAKSIFRFFSMLLHLGSLSTHFNSRHC